MNWIERILKKLQQRPIVRYTFATLLVLILSFFIIRFFYKTFFYQTQVWDLIPESAGIVIESEDLFSFYKGLSQQAFVQNFSQTPYFQTLLGRGNYFEELVKTDTELRRYFLRKPFYLSIHLTGKNQFGTIFYTELSNEYETEILQKLIQKLQQEGGFRVNTRSFEGYIVTEISHLEEEQYFSFLLYENIFIGTYSSLLIDEFIREIENNEPSFQKSNSEEFTKYISELQKSDLQVYLNPKQTADFLSLPIQNQNNSPFESINNFANNSFFNFQLNQDFLGLQGFAFAEEDNISEFVNVFRGQKPTRITLYQALSDATAVSYLFAFSDTELFFDNLLAYNQKQSDTFLEKQTVLQSSYDFDITSFYRQIDGEIGICYLENGQGFQLGKLMLLKAKQPSRVIRILNQFSQKANRGKASRLENNTYRGLTIQQIAMANVPQNLFGDWAKDFENMFYTFVDKWVVIADSQASLQTWVDDYKSQNTWGKKRQYQSLIQQMEPRSNFLILGSINKSWDFIQRNLSEEWKEITGLYEQELKFIDYYTLQIRPEQEYFAIKAKLIFQKTIQVQEDKRSLQTIINLPFQNRLSSPPFVFQNPKTEQYEILVQDQENRLYFVNEIGKISWDKKLTSPLKSEPKSIFYQGKQGFTFITSDKIYFTNQFGNPQVGFPIIPQKVLEYFSYFPHQNGSKPNFLVMSRDLEMYLYDSKRQVLPGWNPRRLPSILIAPPKAFRVGEEDYVFIIQEDSRVNILDAKGKSKSGFPLQLDNEISNPVFIKQAGNSDQIRFICLSDGGELIELDFEGKVQKIEQKIEDIPDQETFLLISPNNENWLLASEFNGKVAILNQSGDILFQKDYPDSGRIELQYFSFNTGLELIAITQSGQTELYNLKGESISVPIKSDAPVAVVLSPDNRLLIYRVFQKLLTGFELN